MKVKYMFLGMILLLNISCNTDDEFELNEYDYLIFGHFYGECLGEECIETFKLTDKKLFEDTSDDYTGQNLNFVELDNIKFEMVKDLTNLLPNRLLNDTTTTFGCPDCTDGGGLFIQYSENGNSKSWRIDQMRSNVPVYLHTFMDEVNEKIALINN